MLKTINVDYREVGFRFENTGFKGSCAFTSEKFYSLVIAGFKDCDNVKCR